MTRLTKIAFTFLTLVALTPFLALALDFKELYHQGLAVYPIVIGMFFLGVELLAYAKIVLHPKTPRPVNP